MKLDYLLTKILDTERGCFFVEGVKVNKKEVKLKLRKIIMTEERDGIIMSHRAYNKMCSAQHKVSDNQVK